MTPQTKNRIALAAVLAALAATFTSVSEAAEPIGSVISAKGECLATAGDGTSRKLELKSPVFLNDKVSTKADSSIQIMLNDDSVLSQGEKSELVIDSYVYQPKQKDVKCSIKAVKGLFRMVTGKITDLNPERFKVKTRMATVGIRGCEVGFKLHAKREDFYILYLPPGKSILIERNQLANEIVTDAKMGMDQILTVVRQGVVVSIEEGGGLQKRDMTTREIMELMSSVFEITDAVDDSTEDRNQNEHAANLLPAPVDDTGGGGGGKGKPYTTPPTTLPPVLVGGHPTLTQWEWGLWEDGTVFYSGNRNLGCSFLTLGEYTAIRNATTVYNLSGSGMSGAVIYHNASGETKDVSGFLIFDVNIGNSATPTWGGTFDLSNTDGDRLQFSVDSASGGGTIDNNGRFQLNNLDTYTLTVNKDTFGMPTLTSWDGQLITDGSGDITGASGEYHFEHGTDARVDGAWGTNLN